MTEDELIAYCLEITEILRHRTHKIRSLCVMALHTDGSQHKQWYIEQIFKATGGEIKDVPLGWEPSTPP